MSKPQIPVDPLSGHLGHLSIPQQHNLDKLRKELQDEGSFVPERHDDAYLLRFLRARKFDFAASKLMFKNCEEWRKSFGVDDLANFEFTEAVEVDKYYPQFYHKTDKDGRPLYVERLGNINVDQLYRITTKDRLLKRLVSEYENFIKYRLPACSKEVGHEVETSCTILDLKGVGISQFYRVKDYVMEASTIGQNYYPESMGKFYIINAPFLFSGVWALIKPWLDEVTVAKINILGSDYKGALLQQIPAENLPSDLGGNCKCVGGCSLSNDGPWKTPTATTSAAAPTPAPTA